MITLFISVQVLARLVTWIIAKLEGAHDARKAKKGGKIMHGLSLAVRVLGGALGALAVNYYFTQLLEHWLIATALLLFTLAGYYFLVFDVTYNLTMELPVNNIGSTANTDKGLKRLFSQGKGVILAKCCWIAIGEIMFWAFYFGR